MLRADGDGRDQLFLCHWALSRGHPEPVQHPTQLALAGSALTLSELRPVQAALEEAVPWMQDSCWPEPLYVRADLERPGRRDRAAVTVSLSSAQMADRPPLPENPCTLAENWRPYPRSAPSSPADGSK